MTTPQTLINQEKRVLAFFLTTLLITCLSGFISYLLQSNTIWIQWSYLLHVLAGLLMIAPLTSYGLRHFKRTLGLKRPLMTISGLTTIILALATVLSGLHITLIGQVEALRWIYDAHVTTAIIILALLALHLILHKLTLSNRRAQSEGAVFTTLHRSTFKQMGYGITIALVITALLSGTYALLPSPYIDEPSVTPYELSYGDHPFRPSQTETMNGSFLDTRRLNNSDRCGTCHAAITQEWQGSMHAQAASDQSYQTNVNLLAKKKGMATTRYCEGCHVPVALLSGELSKGGKLDTYGHMHEGVGCLGCHGIDQVVHLKGVASYNMNPVNDYLFADSDSWLGTKLHNFLVRIQPRSHRENMNRPVIFQPEICATCHTQFMDKDVNNWGWVKMQDEYMAWLNSPYSGQSGHEFTDQQMVRCQDCHFPLTELDDPSADRNGMAASHRSLGANTAIPYYTGNQEQLKRVSQFLQADKVRISIEEPNRTDATLGHKYISPEIALKQDAPGYFYLNEAVNINLVVTNANVGHDFPGGTTDINEVWIHFKVVDGQNRIVYESGALTEENDVDPNALFYSSLAIDRHGKHVWKHDLFNMVGDSYRNVIKAGKSDIVSYDFTVPSWAKGPLTISASVRYRKFNNRYARWALKDETIELPIVDMARDAITVPIRFKHEVEQSTPAQ